MKKSTIASLIILCGSTAALAQVATPPGEGGMMNNSMMSPGANTSVDQPVGDPAENTMMPDPTTGNTPTPM